MAAAVQARLDLAPADAVAYFRAKGTAMSWDWHDMLRDDHAAAFTVAKATTVDVLTAIRKQVDKAISSGMTFADFKRTLRPTLQDLGWWGKAEVLDASTGELTQAQLGSTRRLRTIYQTNVQTAYMAGRYQRYVAQADIFPYWRYVAVMDSRTRPAHAALNGKVFRWDDPVWQVIWPPNGWGCRCRVQALTEQDVRTRGLTVESSTGRIVSKQVLPEKDGPEVTVQGVRYTDPNGRDAVFWPDPGWDYNPGAKLVSNARDVLAAKLDKAPQEVAGAVVRDVVGGNGFEDWAANPQGAFPVAVLPQDAAQRLGANTRVGWMLWQGLSAATGSGLTPADVALAQDVIEQGKAVQTDESGLTYFWPRPEADGGGVIGIRVVLVNGRLELARMMLMTLAQALANPFAVAALGLGG